MAVLMLVVVVIVVGVAIAWRSEISSSTGGEQPNTGSMVPGVRASCGSLRRDDWPGNLRVGLRVRSARMAPDRAGWMFPAGVIASAILGTLSLKRNSGRALGITGLALAVLSAGAFFAMVVSVDY